MSPPLLTRALVANSGTLYTLTSTRSPAPKVTVPNSALLSFALSVFAGVAVALGALSVACGRGCAAGIAAGGLCTVPASGAACWALTPLMRMKRNPNRERLRRRVQFTIPGSLHKSEMLLKLNQSVARRFSFPSRNLRQPSKFSTAGSSFVIELSFSRCYICRTYNFNRTQFTFFRGWSRQYFFVKYRAEPVGSPVRG